jgi:hypothetical protein
VKDDSLIDEMRAAIRHDRERAPRPQDQPQPAAEPAAKSAADGERKRSFRLRLGRARRRV